MRFLTALMVGAARLLCLTGVRLILLPVALVGYAASLGGNEG
jgi:hypothetical protein